MQNKFIHFQRTYLTRQNNYFNYAANLFESIIESAVVILVAAVLNFILLNFVKMCWHTYRSTYIGKVFVDQFGDNYEGFIKILKGDLIGVSLELALAAFIFCLILSSVFQFFYVARFFHGTGSFLLKLIYWGMPLTVIVSYYFYSRPENPFAYYRTAYVLYCFSTLCLFNLCFKISNKLIPELGAMIHGVTQAVQAIARSANSRSEDQPQKSEDPMDETEETAAIKPDDGPELPFGV